MKPDVYCQLWECPECGQRELVSYEWLAKNGGPICPECDWDMELASCKAQSQNERL